MKAKAKALAVQGKEDDAPLPELYFHEGYNAYECMGCGEVIEVRRFAMLKVEGVIQRVRLQGHPENLLLWLELHRLDHAKCGSFQDAAKAKDFREHRSVRRKS